MIKTILMNYLEETGKTRADLAAEINELMGFEYVNRQDLYQWITVGRPPRKGRIQVIRDRAEGELWELMQAILDTLEVPTVAA
jgi:hypothetical protein